MPLLNNLFMFDFEKLTIYQRSRAFYLLVSKTLQGNRAIPHYFQDQLGRAALSISLNIAEGGARITRPARRNHYVIARGSLFECVACLDILLDQGQIPPEKHQTLYSESEELSKMLLSMIRKLGGP